MRYRFVLFCLLIISNMQVNAQEMQEINAKFNSQPVITISDEEVIIEFDYSLYAKDANIRFTYAIFDSDGNKVSDKNRYIKPNSDSETYKTTLNFDYQKFAGYQSPFFLKATICWDISDNLECELATIDATSFALDVSSSFTSLSSDYTISKHSTVVGQSILDNSKKIRDQEEVIKELEYKKKNCYRCHGKGTVSGGNCNVCKGTGIIKAGYYTPQFFTCNYCGGTGSKKVACIECQRTDLSISFARKLLKDYQKTHGMTKEAAKLYFEHEAWKAQSDLNYQNAVNEIVDSYLDDSGTSQSSTTSDSPCSMCHGTGIDPFPWKDAASNAGNGPFGYTNQSGHKCPYCDERVWHQHKRCPKCNVR